MKSIVDLFRDKPGFVCLGGCIDKDIACAEESLGLIFNQEYKECLKAFGVMSFADKELTGICDSKRLNVVNVTNFERENNNTVSNNWYVIEQTGIDGIVIWQSSTGEIYRTMPNVESVKICDSLSEYISMV